ncbi:MAG: hypothetical protein FK732_12905 [Asgard group archaeon]|nr:hypothetical protein [Asgard group archaeon]
MTSVILLIALYGMVLEGVTAFPLISVSKARPICPSSPMLTALHVPITSQVESIIIFPSNSVSPFKEADDLSLSFFSAMAALLLRLPLSLRTPQYANLTGIC